jgi:hypothetical protein
VSPTTPRLILAFILFVGFFARAATFKSPILDHHSWRQADTAAISRNFYRERFNQLLAILLGVAAFTSFVRSTSFHSWCEYGADSVLFCESVDRFAERDDRVVFIGNNDPALLFCMDRKGWLVSEDESTEERIRSIWKAGAKIAVVPRRAAAV